MPIRLIQLYDNHIACRDRDLIKMLITATPYFALAERVEVAYYVLRFKRSTVMKVNTIANLKVPQCRIFIRLPMIRQIAAEFAVLN